MDAGVLRQALAVATVATAILVALAFGPAPAFAGTRTNPGVFEVSNPPAHVSGKLKLTVTTKASRVTVYASPTILRDAPGVVRLAKDAELTKGKLTVSVPAGLKAGAYEVIACPATGSGGCAASEDLMVKVPSKLAPLRTSATIPETALAATATIGKAGGTVTATGADGTKFMLSVAAGSVSDGTQVTMTPLSAVSDAKWAGKFVGAVQLAPQGLPLYKGGTLTVTPRKPVPKADRVAFGENDTGSNVSEVPLTPAKGTKAPIAYLSDYGIADAPDGAEDVSPPSASSIMDFYNEQGARVLDEEHDGQISSQQASEQIAELVDQAFTDVRSSEVPAGLNDDDAATQASSDILSLLRTVALEFGEDSPKFKDFSTQSITLLQEMLKAWYNRAQQQCAADSDLSHLPGYISRILAAERDLQLLDDASLASQRLQCATFEVQFDSVVTDDNSQQGPGYSGIATMEYKADATVTATDPQNDGYSGSATPTFTASGQIIDGPTVGGDPDFPWSCPGDILTAESASAGSPFQASLTLPSSLPAAGSAVLDVSVGTPQETFDDYTPACPDLSNGANDSSTVLSWWARTFADDHSLDQQIQDPYALTLEEVAGAGSTVAQGSWNLSGEQTTVKVVHRPPPFVPLK